MNCPKCGAWVLPNSNKCVKCGYVLKSNQKIDPFAQDEQTTKEVRPTQAHFKKQKESSGGGFFGGGVGNIFGNLFSDFFGEEESSGYDADPKNYDDFGNEINVPDEFERESIEVKDVEIVEDDGNNDENKRKK